MIPKVRFDPREVSCPKCGAMMGQPCSDPGIVHAQRMRDAMLSFVRGDQHTAPKEQVTVDIVERVARAILSETEEFHPDDWWRIQHVALSAIEAMVQPTNSMIEAGKHERACLHPNEKPETTIAKIWNAMVSSVTHSHKMKAEAFVSKVMKK